MTRKDYKAMAEIISRHAPDLNDAGVALVSDIADWFKSDNGRFDKERFIDACVTPGYRAKHQRNRPTTYVGLALDEQSASRRFTEGR